MKPNYQRGSRRDETQTDAPKSPYYDSRRPSYTSRESTRQNGDAEFRYARNSGGPSQSSHTPNFRHRSDSEHRSDRAETRYSRSYSNAPRPEAPYRTGSERPSYGSSRSSGTSRGGYSSGRDRFSSQSGYSPRPGNAQNDNRYKSGTGYGDDRRDTRGRSYSSDRSAPLRQRDSRAHSHRDGSGSRQSKPYGRSADTQYRDRKSHSASRPQFIPGERIVHDQDAEFRLNKYIAHSGFTSRRKADELISEGRVKVNGITITDLGVRVHPSDHITVDGSPVSLRPRHVYLILNKPKDYITTTEDEHNRKTVLDLINIEERVFPVGRLDRNTTGVLILTNDGEMANRLMHPSYEVHRTYSVTLDKPLKLEDAKTASSGVDLDGKMTAPCEIQVNPVNRRELVMTLVEGRNREIRRMFEVLGYMVKKLNRQSYAGITTRGLERGKFRFLHREEIRGLERLLKLERRYEKI